MTFMNKYERRNFSKARKIINWSFIGLLSPVLGIVMAAIGRSVINDLPKQDDATEKRIAKLTGKATLSVWVNVLFLILYIGFAGWGGVVTAHRQQRDERIQQAAVAKAHKDGQSIGFDDGYSMAEINGGSTVSESDYDALIDKYNTLVKAYNSSLHTSLSCYSTTYGINSQFTSTNCY